MPVVRSDREILPLPRRLRYTAGVSVKGGVLPFSHSKGWGSTVENIRTVGFFRFLIVFTAVIHTQTSRRSTDIGGAEVGPCSKSRPGRPPLKGRGSTVLGLKGGVPPFHLSTEPPGHRALHTDCRQTRKLGDLGSSAGFRVTGGRKVLPGWAKTRPCSHAEALSYLFQVFGRPWGAQALRFHFSAHDPILVEHRPQAWRLDT